MSQLNILLANKVVTPIINLLFCSNPHPSLASKGSAVADGDSRVLKLQKYLFISTIRVGPQSQINSQDYQKRSVMDNESQTTNPG